MRRALATAAAAAAAAAALLAIAAPAQAANAGPVGVDPNPLAACALNAQAPEINALHWWHMRGIAEIDCQLPGPSSVELRICLETLEGAAFVTVECETNTSTQTGTFRWWADVGASCRFEPWNTPHPVWRTVALARVQYTSWDVLESTSPPMASPCGLD